MAAPGYFGGNLSFGELMVVVGAFMQVQQALRWFIDNFSSIADWRATLLRIASFRETTVTIHLRESGDRHTHRLHDVERAARQAPAGRPCAHRRRTRAGKTILFRAIAGLRPWGSGSIALPSSDRVMFMPRRPYAPLGTLRAALTILRRRPPTKTRSSALCCSVLA